LPVVRLLWSILAGRLLHALTAVIGTKGEFAAMQKSSPVPGVLLTPVGTLAKRQAVHRESAAAPMMVGPDS
jgi:hypothetical protein